MIIRLSLLVIYHFRVGAHEGRASVLFFSLFSFTFFKTFFVIYNIINIQS
jgi:hypothetical protein